MAEKLLLKDQLFNATSVGQLASEHAAAVPGFDAQHFVAQCLSGFGERELMARLDWIATCLETQLAPDFSAMADQLEAAMPALLDPAEGDDDFGQFIHAVPGILAVRHGLEQHRARAMKLLYAATKRFSMEFSIRAFLTRWPDETLADLAVWAVDENYHVRRLVSEGTRPRLPWGQGVALTPAQTLPLLDLLFADRARFVTRSVANHLNDLSKAVPDQVIARFERWRASGRQDQTELGWMQRHALRTLVKQGHSGALDALGFRADAAVKAEIQLAQAQLPIGDVLEFDVLLECAEDTPVLLDYRIGFVRPAGKTAEKVFKLKALELSAGAAVRLSKRHRLKADATTFRLHAGVHRLTLQVNGRDAAQAEFTLTR